MDRLFPTHTKRLYVCYIPEIFSFNFALLCVGVASAQSVPCRGVSFHYASIDFGRGCEREHVFVTVGG